MSNQLPLNKEEEEELEHFKWHCPLWRIFEQFIPK